MTRTSAFNFSPGPRHRQAGFTLLEILLVLTIIGMAGVLIVPNIGSLESRTFTAQVRGAHNLLNHARRMAVVQGQPATARFILNAGEPAAERVQPSVGDWISEGIDVSFIDSTDRQIDVEDQLDVIFYPEGGSTGGTLFFVQNDDAAALVIDPFTGRIQTQ